MPFSIVRQDITKMQVDAIVNAANTELQMGGGVCGAIFSAAGARELQAACRGLGPIQTGGAVITPGFQLPAKYVIHAAGPVYHRWHKKTCEAQLRSAYLESLRLATEHQCESIAFPLISSGIYGYPKEEALQVATEAIGDYLVDHELQVYLAVFDKDSFVLSKKLLGQVEHYIDQHYVERHTPSRRDLLDVEEAALEDRGIASCQTVDAQAPDISTSYQTRFLPGEPRQDAPNAQMAPAAGQRKLHPLQPSAGQQKPIQPQPAGFAPGLEDLLGHMDEPFSLTLLKLIDAKGKTDVEVYKRANLSRKLFSKIRTGKGYTPRKATILALAVALELSLPETDDLLGRAGYALSHASRFDVIVEFFILQGNYNIFEINQVLFQYDQPLLGG